jgi:hypothetical protein
VAARKSSPISAIAARTSGCTQAAGAVPADSDRAFVGSARELKNAAAICDRPAL